VPALPESEGKKEPRLPQPRLLLIMLLAALPLTLENLQEVTALLFCLRAKSFAISKYSTNLTAMVFSGAWFFGFWGFSRLIGL